VALRALSHRLKAASDLLSVGSQARAPANAPSQPRRALFVVVGGSEPSPCCTGERTSPHNQKEMLCFRSAFRRCSQSMCALPRKNKHGEVLAYGVGRLELCPNSGPCLRSRTHIHAVSGSGNATPLHRTRYSAVPMAVSVGLLLDAEFIQGHFQCRPFMCACARGWFPGRTGRVPFHSA